MFKRLFRPKYLLVILFIASLAACASTPATSTKNSPGPADGSRANSASRIEIPAGAPIAVKLVDFINSEHEPVGQVFRGSVDIPVVVNGRTAIKESTQVLLRLVEDQAPGNAEGQKILTLDLVGFKIGRQWMKIEVVRESEASQPRSESAERVADVTDTVYEKKSAATGQDPGTSAPIVAKGQQLIVPSNTRLTFTLRQSIRLLPD